MHQKLDITLVYALVLSTTLTLMAAGRASAGILILWISGPLQIPETWLQSLLSIVLGLLITTPVKTLMNRRWISYQHVLSNIPGNTGGQDPQTPQSRYANPVMALPPLTGSLAMVWALTNHPDLLSGFIAPLASIGSLVGFALATVLSFAPLGIRMGSSRLDPGLDANVTGIVLTVTAYTTALLPPIVLAILR